MGFLLGLLKDLDNVCMQCGRGKDIGFGRRSHLIVIGKQPEHVINTCSRNDCSLKDIHPQTAASQARAAA
jgi:hypothetical protein